MIKYDFNDNINKYYEYGYVIKNNYPVFFVNGLNDISINELVVFENNSLGIVVSLNEHFIQVAPLSNAPIPINSKVARTKSLFKIPVSLSLLGQVLDNFGQSMYSELSSSESSYEYIDIDLTAKSISNRVKITSPFYTGATVVDVLLPLGKGQRELVIGDSLVGKTSFLLQMCNFQTKQNAIVIYCCIGKSKSDLKNIEDYFTYNNMKKQSILFFSSSSDPAISIINMPLIATSTAEWFCQQGYDVILVLDDLSTHAKYYREFALLNNKFPGRSSYPGDIFHFHAKILERAGNFVLSTPDKSNNKSEVSITCFPVVNTVENDISGYIQTNVMSITDGHLFFDKDIFVKGRKPSINYFLSVTRVGRQTQNILRWSINREIMSFLTLYEKVQGFVRFGAELNEGTKSTLLMGERLEICFNQDVSSTYTISLQIMLICLVWLGIWNSESLDSVKDSINKIKSMYETDDSYAGLIDSLVYNATSMNQLLFIVNQNLSNIIKYV